jgi:hypothetical protein
MQKSYGGTHKQVEHVGIATQIASVTTLYDDYYPTLIALLLMQTTRTHGEKLKEEKSSGLFFEFDGMDVTLVVTHTQSA